MRKFIDIIRESVTPHIDEIAEYLYDLPPDEVGVEQFGDLTVRFEGFSEMCWDDATEKGKTSEGLEREMIADWQGRHPTLKFVTSGWTNGDEPYTETMFYAVFTNA